MEWSDSGGAGRGGEPGTGGWAPGGPRVTTVLPRPSECARGGGVRAEAGARREGGRGGNTRVRGGASESEEEERRGSKVRPRVILELVGGARTSGLCFDRRGSGCARVYGASEA